MNDMILEVPKICSHNFGRTRVLFNPVPNQETLDFLLYLLKDNAMSSIYCKYLNNITLQGLLDSLTLDYFAYIISISI